MAGLPECSLAGHQTIAAFLLLWLRWDGTNLDWNTQIGSIESRIGLDEFLGSDLVPLLDDGVDIGGGIFGIGIPILQFWRNGQMPIVGEI